eukprot:2447487-Amphidinium_carterae.1
MGFVLLQTSWLCTRKVNRAMLAAAAARTPRGASSERPESTNEPFFSPGNRLNLFRDSNLFLNDLHPHPAVSNQQKTPEGRGLIFSVVGSIDASTKSFVVGSVSSSKT